MPLPCRLLSVEHGLLHRQWLAPDAMRSDRPEVRASFEAQFALHIDAWSVISRLAKGNEMVAPTFFQQDALEQ